MINSALEIHQLSWPYLESDEQGRATLSNSRIPVSYLIQEKQTHGWSPEEIHLQYPLLSLAQIHSALSYYYMNPEEINQEILQNQQIIETHKKYLQNKGTGLSGAEFLAKFKQKLST